jgi:hypothetical protein
MEVFYTKAEVLALMMRIQNALSAMEPPIMVADDEKLDQTFKDGFRLFLQEWEDYKSRIKSTGTFLQWENVDSFRARAEEWRRRAEAAGVKTYAIAIPPTKKDDDSFKVPWWVWLAGGGLLVWKLSPLRTAERVKALSKVSK